MCLWERKRSVSTSIAPWANMDRVSSARTLEKEFELAWRRIKGKSSAQLVCYIVAVTSFVPISLFYCRLCRRVICLLPSWKSAKSLSIFLCLSRPFPWTPKQLNFRFSIHKDKRKFLYFLSHDILKCLFSRFVIVCSSGCPATVIKHFIRAGSKFLLVKQFKHPYNLQCS